MNRLAPLTAALGLGALLSACGANAPSSLSSDATTDGVPPVIIDSNVNFQSLLDETRIESASITDHELTLNLEFGGGCAEHSFEALSHGGFMESLPVQLYVFLRHDGHGDACEALLHEQVTFDLTPVAKLYRAGYPGHQDHPIILRIVEAPDRETRITYDPNQS